MTPMKSSTITIPRSDSPQPLSACRLELGQPWNAGLDTAFRPAHVLLSWTPEALHVRAVLTDDEIRTAATGDNQRMWELGDVFEMFLMVEGRQDYVEMHVTPNSKRLHLALPGVGGKATPESKPLEFEEMLVRKIGFESSVQRTADGWSVTARVPAHVLGVTSLQPGQRLRVAFARYDAARDSDPVLSTTASHPVIGFHRPEEWTRVTLLTD